MRKLRRSSPLTGTFYTYGLNKRNNFLAAPKCECGCGQYMNMILKTDNDVMGFMYAMLEEHDCNHCGIFARKKDNTILMGLKLDGEIKCYSVPTETIQNAKDFVAETQQELRLHCYGLLEQVDEESYKIVMD